MMSSETSQSSDDTQHAALWLVGRGMPNLLRIGAKWVADHGGNIDKDIAIKSGEMGVVFMSITAGSHEIALMHDVKATLKEAAGCTVVFQPMKQPAFPDGFEPVLYGLDVVSDDASGLLAGLTELLQAFGIMIVGHTGERRVVPGPKPLVQSGQKIIVLLPHDFDAAGFRGKLADFVNRFRGDVVSPLRPVSGLLWWW